MNDDQNPNRPKFPDIERKSGPVGLKLSLGSSVWERETSYWYLSDLGGLYREDDGRWYFYPRIYDDDRWVFSEVDLIDAMRRAERWRPPIAIN
jgi:hypothetical protein